jgi:hypothetical protein
MHAQPAAGRRPWVSRTPTSEQDDCPLPSLWALRSLDRYAWKLGSALAGGELPRPLVMSRSAETTSSRSATRSPKRAGRRLAPDCHVQTIVVGIKPTEDPEVDHDTFRTRTPGQQTATAPLPGARSPDRPSGNPLLPVCNRPTTSHGHDGARVRTPRAGASESEIRCLRVRTVGSRQVLRIVSPTRAPSRCGRG